MGSQQRAEKRKTYFARLQKLLDKYPKMLIVCADHVGSRQMAQIRFALRGKAVILMGKNTMIRTCLRRRIAQHPQLEKLLPLVKDNIGFIFCIDEPSEIRNIIMEHKVPAPARQGVLAPIDVFIPAGPTGMDPGSTSFFQALGISTKIVKGQIEIQTDVHLIKANEKVSASAASLLQKLNIRPFEYGLKTVWIYDDGSVFSADILDITDEQIISQFQDGAKNIAALSRQICLPTAAAIPHCIIEAFKVCTSLVLDSDFTFPQMEKLKKYLENPEAFAVAPAPVSGGGGKKAAAVKEEEPEEEEDDLGFSLFD